MTMEKSGSKKKRNKPGFTVASGKHTLSSNELLHCFLSRFHEFDFLLFHRMRAQPKASSSVGALEPLKGIDADIFRCGLEDVQAPRLLHVRCAQAEAELFAASCERSQVWSPIHEDDTRLQVSGKSISEGEQDSVR
ncbi:uncharacterized protein LOC112342438 [Selaginella moellendorffii]|uniref:uncharacterized protein LOC112342438 n=1 Tax=Selaginella moellendorffii TaxID=88036 RepID=UPI000D1C5D44|nr:uncharacterized protein LOC112342438 [Selaginella moellendorffii]|eukprot:XP_024520015.1 uncharacterized protein LOC112342438 [Selaginella moellendorffii]